MIKRWVRRTESSHHVIEALRGLVSVRFVVGRHWLRYVASCNASDVTPFARLVAKAAVGSTRLAGKYGSRHLGTVSVKKVGAWEHVALRSAAARLNQLPR